MFCGKCGSNIPEGNDFCMNCGASVREMQGKQGQTSYANTPVDQNANYSKKPRKKRVMIALICGLMTLIAAGVACYFIFFSTSYALEPGMTKAEVHEAMLDEGFYLERENKYGGYLEDLGNVDVYCHFNSAGELDSIKLDVDGASKGVMTKYLKDKLDFEQVTYQDDEEEVKAYVYDKSGVFGIHRVTEDDVEIYFEKYCDEDRKSQVQRICDRLIY